MDENISDMSDGELDKTLFARALQRAAKNKGITQENLAEEIHKNRNTVAGMFTAQRFTSIPTLISICDVLDITPDYLLSHYLTNKTVISEDEYHKILNLLNELKPNELTMLYGIIELIIKNRD
ncbi:helix-turn-helix transcriptional regulator [Lachnospiraceae bacterium OttesenSCG-928-D06]|nr:helix-turn-helix transcriptional regulator [Lachnospiraceae bacterium OttesenSCG-928-D06]